MFTLPLGLGVALGFFVGILVHEVLHHRVAVMVGDPTPRLMGRTSASPTAHADVLGSYVLPAIYAVAALFGHIAPFGRMPAPFGWGKRHAIGARGYRKGPRDVVIVSLAGPVGTAMVAYIFGVVSDVSSGSVAESFAGAAIVCASLTIFELLPIPGRDGARILGAFLSPRAALKMEELAEYHVLFMVGLFLLLQPVTDSMLTVSCRVLTSICR